MSGGGEIVTLLGLAQVNHADAVGNTAASAITGMVSTMVASVAVSIAATIGAREIFFLLRYAALE